MYARAAKAQARAAKAQASLHICADLPEHLLFDNAIISKIACARYYLKFPNSQVLTFVR